jgi:hypothetical protein
MTVDIEISGDTAPPKDDPIVYGMSFMVSTLFPPG